MLAAVYDLTSSALEVPSGYFSDRLGRRLTLLMSLSMTMAGALIIGIGDGFAWLALGQVLLGAGTAFQSGTDSALLYDSLIETGREDEVTAQELKAWRFMFSGLAVSAFLGGVIASYAGAWAFIASAASGALALTLVASFQEPARVRSAEPRRSLASDGGTVIVVSAESCVGLAVCLKCRDVCFQPCTMGVRPAVHR